MGFHTPGISADIFSLSFIAGHYNYWAIIILMMTGLYVVMSRGNLIKKIVGLNLFQISVFLLFISLGKIMGGTAPIFLKDASAHTLYSNPLPSVLILTAIVVGVATTSVALALAVRIKEAYGSVEEDVILSLNYEADLRDVEVVKPPRKGRKTEAVKAGDKQK